MPTSIHLPADLLRAIDREAVRRNVTRNRLIASILARAMEEKDDWSPNLFSQLHESALEEKR
jgi:metal-responsive CopG/Arc/MetJ family transcriptional regulator